MSPDRERVLSMINGAWMCQAIGVACELGIPDRIGAQAVDCATLAADIGVPPPALRRYLRALVSLGIVNERDDGAFALAPDGALLTTRADGSLHAWAIVSARRGWSAWTHLAAGIRAGSNVRDRADLEAYAAFDRDPPSATLFNRAMGDLTRPVARALREKVRFSGDESVVDVGGGAGHLVMPLLAAYASMRATLFDLPHARVLAEQVIAAEGLADRCRFDGGSFFDGVPGGADVYLLKSVLHNWNDADALRILARCREATREGSRLLVLERILAPRPACTPLDQENARSDLQMLLACDGRERDEREFHALLDSAGFRLARITPLTPLMAAMEAVPV